MNRTNKFFKYNNTRLGGWICGFSMKGTFTTREKFTIKNPPPFAKFIYAPKGEFKFAKQLPCPKIFEDSWLVKRED
jgi:hypothetical protein